MSKKMRLPVNQCLSPQRVLVHSSWQQDPLDHLRVRVDCRDDDGAALRARVVELEAALAAAQAECDKWREVVERIKKLPRYVPAMMGYNSKYVSDTELDRALIDGSGEVVE